MESDPIGFAWRSAPVQHAMAAALAVGIGLPCALFALLCLRDLIGVLSQAGSARSAFLAIDLPLPGAAASHPVAVFAGWPLDADALTLAALSGLAGAALIFAGLGWLVGRLCFLAQSRMAARIRARATDAILRSPSGAREDLRALPGLVAQVLAGFSVPAAGAFVLPAMTLAAILLALVMAELAASRLVPAVAIALFAAGLARLLILRRAASRTDLRAQERTAAQAGLADLIQRMPAVRAHGAAPFERRRLGLRALAARGTLGRAEAALAYARAPALALVVLLPAILVATALWHEAPVGSDRVAPGALVAAAAAFGLAATLIAACLRLWFARAEIAPIFRALAQAIEGLTIRQHGSGARAFPGGGRLEARGAGAYDAASGERLIGIDLDLPLPGHIAILGERGSGSRALAALLAGQIEPTAGSVSYGGVELRNLDPVERAHRIAFAGAEALLIDGTLKQNLLYGARSDDREALDIEKRIAMLSLTGLDAFVYARGLDGTVDPASTPTVAAAIVKARQAVRAALEAQGMARLVEAFDPERYLHQGTIGENILFGEALKPAFSQERLANHPYLRAVLEAEDLTHAFIEIGLQVARSTVEIFSDLPDDHPLFESFSLFPARERGFFEDLIARQSGATGFRRGLAGLRDRERLIGLTLRYSETRHRFGLIDAPFEARIIDARRSFAALLPPKFREKVEFYDPDKLTAAASLEENVLFGRITQGEAAAETRVRALVRRVLAEQGLEPAVYRIGLASRVESDVAPTGTMRRASLGGGAIGPRERIAIDLVRCLARRPDILVVSPPVDGIRPDDLHERVDRLRALRKGQALIVCLPDEDSLTDFAPFDTVIRVERNTVATTVETDAPAALEPVV